MPTRYRLFAVAGLIVVAVVVLIAAACGDDDDGGGNSAQLDEIQATLDELVADSTRSHVLATMTAFRVEDMHALDEQVQQASEIEPGWAAAIGRLHHAVAGTSWPDELAETAGTLEENLAAAEAAAEADDLAEFKTATVLAHDAWHELEHSAYAYIGGGEDGSESDSHGNSMDDHEEDTGDGEETAVPTRMQ
jgi:hypothetical protein